MPKTFNRSSENRAWADFLRLSGTRRNSTASCARQLSSCVPRLQNSRSDLTTGPRAIAPPTEHAPRLRGHAGWILVFLQGEKENVPVAKFKNISSAGRLFLCKLLSACLCAWLYLKHVHEDIKLIVCAHWGLLHLQCDPSCYYGAPFSEQCKTYQ